MRMQGRELTLKNGTKVEMHTVTVGETGKYLKFMKEVYDKNDMLELNPNEVEEMKRRRVRKEIKEFAKAKRQILLGVYSEKKLIAACSVSRVSDKEKESHRAALSIAIAPEFRKIGLGSSLMKLAFDFAGKVAYEQFETTVLESNTTAFILCTEYGFKAMCRFPRAFKNIKGAYQDSILLIKYLNNYET